MKACGLIVEYNPFHNGHLYHARKAKEISNADCTIAVMSGNFLQRGEPAIIDKFSRAKIAVEQGIDLVVELPYYYAVQHSELFAKGAITLLSALKVHSVCFGSEHGDIAGFNQILGLLSNHQDTYITYFKQALTEGNSYPKAHQKAFYRIGGKDLPVDIAKPNNILGFQYVHSINEIDRSITPLTIQRIQNDYHDQVISEPIASATSIRNELLKEKLPDKILKTTIPNTTRRILLEYKKDHSYWHDWEKYFPLLRYRILTMTADEISGIHGVVEGLEHRLINAAKEAISFESFMKAIKTKRYTWTSLQRVCTHILTNTTKQEIIAKIHTEMEPIRILAMSSVGQQYLNQNKKQISASVYTSIKKPYPNHLLDERLAAAYYSILPIQSQQEQIAQDYMPPYRL
ncbi:nucleotidyltransferase [Gracilibacillus dipsosauri]|uniref:nucleotidyltransferase n=1 Tax=Gracilibacillus dipsosauri TaxID=178340 RepID=UPI002409C6D0